MMTSEPSALRVALLAGTLDQGGAEKQLMYMIRALRNAGVDVRVYSLTQGEYYDRVLREIGTPPEWVGRRKAPPSRLVAFTRRLRTFRPHVVQAVHFFTNLYVALAARMLRAIDIGSLRGDGAYELEQNGRWGLPLLRTPRSLMANSQLACENAAGFGVPVSAVHCVPNVIDLAAFDAAAGGPYPVSTQDRVHVMAIGRLVAVSSKAGSAAR